MKLGSALLFRSTLCPPIFKSSILLLFPCSPFLLFPFSLIFSFSFFLFTFSLITYLNTINFTTISKQMKSRIQLKKNEERRIKTGHLWIFSNEIVSADGDPQNGDMVEVYDSRNNFLGTAFYNKNSLIAGRFISAERADDLQSLFRTRLNGSLRFKKKPLPGKRCFPDGLQRKRLSARTNNR